MSRSKHVDLSARLAEALILKNDNSGLNKSRTQFSLADLSQIRIIDHRLAVLTLLNLTEVLFWELRSSEDREILSEINQTITQLINIAKPFDDTEYPEVPKEILSYKFLLNPVRLSIVKILYRSLSYPAAELRNLLGIPWGTFNDHLEALSKKGFIESQKEFIKENPRNILYLTSSGASEYSTLKSILHSVIAS